MTWKFIYTYRERCKTGPAHNRCWNWSPFTSKHTSMRFFKFWNTFSKVSTLTAWISWRIASLSFRLDCSLTQLCQYKYIYWLILVQLHVSAFIGHLWVVRLGWVYFCALCSSIGPKERSRQALDRLLLVSNFLTNFWMQHFDGSRLSPNSVRNAVWHALNEPVFHYLRKRNPRYSTVYIDNCPGPLARESPCIIISGMHGHANIKFSSFTFSRLL